MVADYWFHKSMVFAKVNLKKDQFARFEELFNALEPLIRSPDLVIYYHRSVEKVQKGIKDRGREFEQEIHVNYLLKLERNFTGYFKRHKKVPVLWVDGDRMNPARIREHFQALTMAIDQPIKKGLHKLELGL